MSIFLVLYCEILRGEIVTEQLAPHARAVELFCPAIDVDGATDAFEMLRRAHTRAKTIKIHTVFVRHHRKILDRAKVLGFKIWLDFKIHDTPQTAENFVRALESLGVDYMTIHLSAGIAMVRRIMDTATKIKILGITVPTHIDQHALNTEWRVSGTVEEHVMHLAHLGVNERIHGLVCSGLEAPKIRGVFGNKIVIATPGIRFAQDAWDKQKRVVSPYDAARATADLIVMGRSLHRGAAAFEDALYQIRRGAFARQ